MIYPQNFEQKIGFDQIRQLLKDKCLSTLGEERVNEMNFSDHFEEVDELLNQVAEFVRIIQEEDNFPDQFFFDVRPSLKRIRIEGMYMDEQELFDLRRSLETIRDIIRFLQRNDEEESDCPYPSLKKLAGDITVFPQLITKIDGILNMAKSRIMLRPNCHASDGNWLTRWEVSHVRLTAYSETHNPKAMWTKTWHQPCATVDWLFRWLRD